jgi:iron-sulfur cluster assembly protein
MITLTERAAKHIEKSLAKRGKGVGLRLGVKHVGCSGLAYQIEWADQSKPDEVRFESHGVVVYVAPDSLQFLDGSQVDYVREGLNERFKFSNPNVQSECGCGESFSVA